MSLPDPIAALLRSDPARRRRLVRRAGIEATRRGHRNARYSFDFEDPEIVVRADGDEVARVDPWAEDAAHD